MHWTMADLEALDLEHWEVLCSVAPRWLGVEEEGEGGGGEGPPTAGNKDREVTPEEFKRLFTEG